MEVLDEPILAQLLAQKESLSGYDAAGIYEVFGNTKEDLESYNLNLVLSDDATLFHYSILDGSLEKAPTVARFEKDQEKKISVVSESNHWMVVHLRAEESQTEEAETEMTSAEESASEESVEATTAVKAATTASEETTKSPETKPASTTAPSTTAPSTTAPTTTVTPTTAHTHAWVPVTNTVHHDATYKDAWVQDAAAWDENVLISDAWDETVTTGYKCSTCGETK